MQPTDPSQQAPNSDDTDSDTDARKGARTPDRKHDSAKPSTPERTVPIWFVFVLLVTITLIVLLIVFRNW